MSTKWNSKVNSVAMFCLVALMACAGIAQAEGKSLDGEQCDKQHHGFQKIAKKLGLTDAQKAQVKTIFQGNKDVAKPLLTNLHAEQKKLHVLMHNDPIDEAAIRAEAAKIAVIQADVTVNRAKVGAQFRAILTPAQLEIFKTLHQKRHDVASTATAPSE